MAKRPKLRMTNADYVAIAASPALIMAMVGSLVFFLIEVLYVGQYHARLNYVFALFVFATVLIGRIAIEMGADRAALFALPLAIAMFLVLSKFVSHPSPFSHVINIGLLAIVWWSTHKLTWDCTLIDDNEDASGEGLMQRMGVDASVAAAEPGSAENELLADGAAAQQKPPHVPGIWVLYFSLAALPLFGIGQKWIPVGDLLRRRYAFGLLAVYVASGLALLVTTSFLGLRRYLRQRRVEMPTSMAATWVVTGGVLIAAVMLLATLIPRPQAELALSRVPWQARSPADLSSSRQSLGSDGPSRTDTNDSNNDDNNGRSVIHEESDPDATAMREGDHPTTTSEQAKQPSSGAADSAPGDSSPGNQSEQGEPPGSSKSRETSETPQPQSRQGEAATESSRQPPSAESDAADPDRLASREPTPASTAATPQQDDQDANEPDAGTAADALHSPQLPAGLSRVIGGLSGLLKLALYAVVALALGYLAWRHRLQIAKAATDLLQQLRDFLARWFGGGSAQPTDAADNEAHQPSGPPPRRFASYPDPFANGQHHSMLPDELVRYTFEAFEAWARERGFQRRPDQSPLELIRQAVPQHSPLLAEARQFARLYNEVAYAPGSVSTAAVENLNQFWRLLQQSSQTPLESHS